MKITLAIVPALVAAATFSSFAQQPAPTTVAKADTPATTLKVQTLEVVLPVTVRDRKGQVVSTLTREDFSLEEDGRPQSIKSFAHQDDLPFRLGLLVDTSRSQENALSSERTATGKFIDQMLSRPADKAFLMHFDHQVELLQDFTSGKEKLHHELDEMSTSTSSNDSDHAESRGPETSRDPNTGDEHDRSRGHRGGTQMYDAIYLAANELMKKEPGRKALVVLSDGVDRGSKEPLNDAIDAAEKANLSVYTVYFKGEEHSDSGSGFGHSGGMGGGGGYPGGRRGGQRPTTGSGEQKTDGKKVLQQIASKTGGLYFEAKKNDSFDEVYTQIAEELRGQYLLTYTPDKPPSKDDSDGFHKITLKAKDDKYAVITREGYYSQE